MTRDPYTGSRSLGRVGANLGAALLVGVLVTGLAACRPQTAPAKPPAAAGLSIQDVMNQKVDPSADAVWGAVGTVETKAGVEERRPQTDAEWAALQKHAASLVEGARLLQTPRPVGGDAQDAVGDMASPGARTAAQITGDIKADPERFAQAAARLEKAALEAQAAIGAKDPQALIVAGAEMDAACEACHAAYWYPRAPPLTLPDTDQFGRTAAHP